jgi:hypothetical protein
MSRLINMTQETVIKQDSIELTSSQESKISDKKKQFSLQELVESLKSTVDDIAQITELNSEEKILVTQFFNAFLRLTKPLTPSIAVSQSVLPPSLSDAVQSHIDPTGHLAIQFSDGHMELIDLSQESNRDLMISIIMDVMPKFKALTSFQKRKIETRIRTLSSITKEVQKSADALPASIF